MIRVGIDIGGTKINIGLLDENNSIIANNKIYIRDIKNLTADVRNVIENLCADNRIDIHKISACGIGVPGTVSDDGKTLLKAPNISILPADVVAQFEKELKIPAFLVQDSRAAAYAEYMCGGGKGSKNVVCIAIGTGIGTGIVLDGQIYNGALGSAGELGHICVNEQGRKCGCGKIGCLEKYCAGGGLDITAVEILGDGKTAVDLFNEAKSGNEKAQKAIEEAVVLLGNAVVSVINLLSPECILFSGGLSSQTDLYINPCIEYVKEHCYSSGRLPKIKCAELGEDAPMIGAALIAKGGKKPAPILSASIMCADVLNFGKALDEIKEAGIEYIHCDIMDNHFVPNLMLAPELLNILHEYSDIPFDYHIMAENPITIIDRLTLKADDYVSVHYESTNHLQLALNAVKEKGAKACVAINPATPIDVIYEVLPMVDMVLLMSVNPGFAGQKIVPTSFDKIKRLRNYLDNNGYRDIKIQVDGNCSFENVPKMYDAGAEIFVVGTSSVFQKGHTIKEGTQKLFNILKGNN